jgi:hypothetical protein
MMELKDWYRSKTIWGALVAIFASCANLAGFDFGAQDQKEIVDALTTIAAAFGGVIAVYGRISAQKRVR